MSEKRSGKLSFSSIKDIANRLFRQEKASNSKPILPPTHERGEKEVSETHVLSPIEIEMNESALDLMVTIIRIQVGNQEPYGYEQVADTFERNMDMMNGRLYAWLLVEAQAAGKEEEAKQRFPEMEFQARYEMNFWKKDENMVDIVLKAAAKPKRKI